MILEGRYEIEKGLRAVLGVSQNDYNMGGLLGPQEVIT